MNAVFAARDRRNVWLLAIAQALFMSSGIIGIAFGGLVGYMLAENKIWATLPLAMTVVGGTVAAVPASFLMKRYGRRAGFLMGAGAGVLSGIAGVYALYVGSLELFCLGHFFQGIYRAFAQYYRFAVTDVSPPTMHSRAISYVLAGGVAAAIVGPLIAIWSQDLLAPVSFAGAYAALGALSLIGLAPIWLVDIPRPSIQEQSGPTRPLLEILRQPACIAAILSGTVGFVSMTMVMTATPLSMVDCGFSVDTATLVIQGHMLAMFVPSFFTGGLIARFGVYRIVWAGLALFALSIGAAITGIALANFSAALILIGIAWSFTYVGGSALLTRTYTPAERAKVQGMNEFLIMAGSVIGSLAAGGLLSVFGWNAVNLSTVPMLIVTLVASLWSVWDDRRKTAAPQPS